MTTIEDTPFGRFEIQWGVGDLLVVEERYGDLRDFERGETVMTRDPHYGQWHRLDVYRHKTKSDCIVLLCEITNGIWATGFKLTD